MKEITALDPGPKQTAMVLMLNGRPVDKRLWPNEELLNLFATVELSGTLAVEMIASYGMPVGAEVFDTCVWIGRFIQAWGGTHRLVFRKDVKLHLCGSPRAKDANVRQALLDRFGGKQAALGNKKAPGPLYGFASHTWAALAVACYAYDNPETTNK